MPYTDLATNVWQVIGVEVKKPRIITSGIDYVLPFDWDSECALFVSVYIMCF
jgi:hypothetical protein